MPLYPVMCSVCLRLCSAKLLLQSLSLRTDYVATVLSQVKTSAVADSILEQFLLIVKLLRHFLLRSLWTVAIRAQLWHEQTRASDISACKYLSKIGVVRLRTLHLLLIIVLLLCKQGLCHLFAHFVVVSRLRVFSHR